MKAIAKQLKSSLGKSASVLPLPVLLNSSVLCLPSPSLPQRHGLAGSSSWWGAALLPGRRMSIKWNRFSEVPQITVKLVGLKHWEVRAAWFLGSGIRCCGVAAVPGTVSALAPRSRPSDITGSSNSTKIVLFLQSFFK